MCSALWVTTSCLAACGQRGLSYEVSAKSETLSAPPPSWPKRLKERGPKAEAGHRVQTVFYMLSKHSVSIRH